MIWRKLIKEDIASFANFVSKHAKFVIAAFALLTVYFGLRTFQEIKDGGLLADRVFVSLQGSTSSTKVYGITRNNFSYEFQRTDQAL